MKKYSLLAMGVAFALLTGAACSNETAPSQSNTTKQEVKADLRDKYDVLADEKNEEIELEPVVLSPYAEVIGAELTEPKYEHYAVNREFVVKGKIDKHTDLKGNYVWIKVKHDDGEINNNTFEYYAPLENGVFNQAVHFFNGEGKYNVQIMLPSNERDNYFSELAAIDVINVNPKKERDITYSPIGNASGLEIASPNTGLAEANEIIPIAGRFSNKLTDQKIMLQIKKDNDTWQHILPVSDGQFAYDLPLFFGKGIHEINILIPDPETENRYQFASAFLVDNSSDKQMQPIEYHRGYEERGINLESPRFGGTDTDLMLQIKGNIDSSVDNANEITHLYIKTVKGQDEALDIIPVQDFHFDDSVYLRFGPGNYDVTINIPEARKENSTYFSFSSAAAFTVNNIAAEDNRDLLPSRGIQSESAEIISLAHEITKDKETDFDKAKAIYEYTAKNVAYDVEKLQNSEFEWDDSALKTLATKKVFAKIMHIWLLRFFVPVI